MSGCVRKSNDLKLLCRRPFMDYCQKCRLAKFKPLPDASSMPSSDIAVKTIRTHLLGWGLAGNGELGVRELLEPKHHPNALCWQKRPCQIPLSKKHKIKHASCGHGFTLFATTSSQEPRLFGTGLNTFGQLGYQTVKKKNPTNVPAQFYEWLIEPQPIVLPLAKNKATRVTQLACGLSHAIIATTDGLFSTGNNCHGQGGRAIVNNENYQSMASCGVSHRIEDIETPVRRVVCGLDHTLVLTTAGRVFSFGLGADGQLGDGQFVNRWQPLEVGGDLQGEKIVDIATSADCCLAVNDKGDVFGWGNSEYRLLSSASDGVQVAIPRHLKLPNVGRVTKVAIGGSVCLILNDKGQVYSWGYGFLGHGPEKTMTSTPTLFAPPLFGASPFEPDVKVTSVSAGPMNYAAINNYGDLYVWGKNDWGSLGLGHKTEQYFPLKVDIGFEVLSLSLGRFHSVAIFRTIR